MSYPSIISQPGSSSRNVGPIIDKLASLLDPNEAGTKVGLESRESTEVSQDAIPATPTFASVPFHTLAPGRAERHIKMRGRILEIGSFPYEHITAFAERFPEWEWYGSGRDQGEISAINDHLDRLVLANGNGDDSEDVEGDRDGALPGSSTAFLRNLKRPVKLDIGIQADWDGLFESLGGRGLDEGNEGEVPFRRGGGDEMNTNEGLFDGILLINIIHCCPPDLPAEIFRRSSRLSDCSNYSNPTTASTNHTAPLLSSRPSRGWIAAYGPFKNDDGSYLSQADKDFDIRIQSSHPSLGLRTIASLDEMAMKWGFEKAERHEMPKGNMWVVWRRK